MSTNRLAQAQTLIDLAQEENRDQQDDRITSRVGVLESELRLLEGRYRDAFDAAHRSRASTTSTVDEVRTDLVAGRSLTRLGEYAEARRYLLGALRTSQSALPQPNSLTGSALHYLGLSYHEAGQLDEALTWYAQALRARQLEEPHGKGVAATLNNLGNVHWRLGEFEQASRMHRNAIRLKSLASPFDPVDLAISHANLANLHAELGDISRADHYFESAIAGYNRLPTNPLWSAKVLNDFGSHLWSTGRRATAAEYWRQARAQYLLVLDEDHASVGVVEVNLACHLVASGDPGSAEDLFRAGIRKMSVDHRTNTAVTMSSFAAAAHEAGNTGLAYSVFSEALEYQEQRTGRLSHFYLWILNDRSEALEREGYLLDARREVENTLQLNRLRPNLGPHRPLEGSAVVSGRQLVRSYAIWSSIVRKQLSAGLLTPDEIQDILDEYRIALGTIGPSYRLSFLQDGGRSRPEHVASVLKDAAAFALQSRHSNLRSAQEHAFYFGDTVHSSGLVDAIAHTQARATAGLPPELVARERRLAAEIFQTEQEIESRHQDNSDDRVILDLVGLRYAYEDSLENLIRSYDILSTAYGSHRFADRTTTIPHVQRKLGPSRTLLEYTVAADTLYAFVISDDSATLTSLGPYGDLPQKVEQFVESIQIEDQIRAATLGMDLYQQLVAPLVPSLQDDTWVVVPHQDLLNLPFEALIADDIGDWSVSDAPYLILDKTITYAYSATLFAESPARPIPESRESLFAAAPVFAGGLKLSNEEFGLPGDPAGTTSFEELRGSGREAVSLSRLFDRYRWEIPGSTQVLLGGEASEERIKRLDLSRYRFVHFATHGFVNAARPSLSGLLLNASGAEDGVLHVGEVLGLDLNADLVVLSACRTAVHVTDSGQGLVGLTRAFMYAGTSSVVASLWNSSDAYTAATMGYFYEGMLTGQSTGEALRKAKLTIMEDPSVAARPGLWASFVLIGEA